MKIEELKEQLETRKLETLSFVFRLEDYSSEFIAWQYVKEIARDNHLQVKIVDSLNDVPLDEGFTPTEYLYVFVTDKIQKFTLPSNCIIICNKSDSTEEVRIPKLEHWQFIDYLQTKVPGINRQELEWLITQYVQTDSRVTQTNYFRLDNDIDKIAIFDPAVQGNFFNYLYENGEYNTTSNLTIFDLTGALVKKDVKTAREVLKVFDYIDSKPHVWLLSILLNNFKNILAVQTGINTTAESLGISDKQFYVVKKYNCNYYSAKSLLNIYEMLTNIEYLYKFGGLSQENLADYIICKIFTEGENT